MRRKGPGSGLHTNFFRSSSSGIFEMKVHSQMSPHVRASRLIPIILEETAKLFPVLVNKNCESEIFT